MSYDIEPVRADFPAGGLRIGLAPYNTVEEVERLLDGLRAFIVD